MVHHQRRGLSFQNLILKLQHYWSEQGCVVLQPYDLEMGAGTFHPATTLRSLGDKPWKAVYVQPSRRPTDGRYGENPNRLQHYYQMQVIMKPSPHNAQELYLESLKAIGLDPALHDIRFVEDDWESPTLGAWGLGWEVWCDGMEVTQFTYFQQMGGLDCKPISFELTYGLERLAMYVQGIENVYDLNFNDEGVKYGDVFLRSEQEFSAFNFEYADTSVLFKQFEEASCGLSSVDQCEVKKIGNADYYLANLTVKGGFVKDLLPDIIAKILHGFQWPKSMRFLKSDFMWVRPIKHILAVFNGEALTGRVDLGEGEFFDFSDMTKGHRFLAPQQFKALNFADYQAALSHRYVILKTEERQTMIKDQIDSLLKGQDFTLVEDPGLMNEVAGIVEYPQAYLGQIDADFMELPEEVLMTSMKVHQRYFSLRDRKTNRLAPYFIVVANTSHDRERMKNIIEGNQRVLRARLSDALFFRNQDLKQSLDTYAQKLSAIRFHEKLGSMAQKAERCAAFADLVIDRFLPRLESQKEMIKHACLLSKADLVTGMVGEFPELQGIMGGYYALKSGLAPELAEAIKNHYKPQGPGDECPSDLPSIIVALADKIDALVGFFSVGLKPTGSKDPFALRRSCLGIIRLLKEGNLTVSLKYLLEIAFDNYVKQSLLKQEDACFEEILTFYLERLKGMLKDEGYPYDLIQSVLSVGEVDNVSVVFIRLKALRDFMGTDRAKSLLSLVKRAQNILKIEENKDQRSYDGEIVSDLMTEAQEKDLFAALSEVGDSIGNALTGKDFLKATYELEKLSEPIHVFFDKVTVNVQDRKVRENRLRLLAKMRSMTRKIAEFSEIEER